MATPVAVVTIGGVDYDAADRAAERFNSLDSLTIHLGESPDELAFTLAGIGPVPVFTVGQTCSLTLDGSTVFVGDVESVQQSRTNYGWAAAFTAAGLRARGERVTITAADGSGAAIYNRSPDDPDYLSTDAGLTVGQIIERVLELADNASELDALGIGGYTVSLGVYSLPSATTTDLADLDVVPRTEVSLGGEAMFSQIEDLIHKYHPKYSLRIKPDGVIRVLNVFDMAATTRTLTVPGDGAADPVTWPSFTRTTAGCYTRFVIKGVDVEAAIGSEADGTLVKAWSGAEESAWTYADFVEPRDATDVGTIASLTSTSAVCDPTDGTASASANFWTSANRAGWIQLIYSTGNGIDIFETREIAASTSLSPGGTYTISWDSALPLAHTNYDKYRIVGKSGGLIEVGRLYKFREPDSGLTGLSTWVGSHLRRRFARPMPWANNGKSFNTLTSVGVVMWSRSGDPPYIEMPVTLEVVPSIGGVRFTEPVFAPIANPPLTLSSGYPEDYPDGLPVDVKVMVPYHRGAMTASAPSSGHEGTAHDLYGLERTKTVHVASWLHRGDQADMEALARQYLDVMKDEVIEGSITYLGWPSFNPLDMGYVLNIAIQGAAGPLDGIDLPVRSVTVTWPNDGPVATKVAFKFSNRKRPFEADDLYMHPAFAVGETSGQGGVNVAGGGFAPPVDLTGAGAFNQFMGAASGAAQAFGGAMTDTMGSFAGDVGRSQAGFMASAPDLSQPFYAMPSLSMGMGGGGGGGSKFASAKSPEKPVDYKSGIIDHSTPPTVKNKALEPKPEPLRKSNIETYNTLGAAQHAGPHPATQGPPKEKPSPDLSGLDLSAVVGNNPTELDDEYLQQWMESAGGGE